ncbi:MAG: L-serine ammonia-lyase, iron-sulfur-dependent, subunit alpha [Atopobiaceae bacterium]|jgi:L-cysteine desulfidase|nr:L-serine ammonia-lyase, iron-sulfur-dependent, subunit alpha [Atopobiaceae bacterium]MCH4120355.1 L-serine ammonia-lyase, iron-sulfur-dependent, subunit alpha [Atopobiaceae bacterium]MCI1389436.1 L-serine ammonia-lyase, iron-sulfur-dependent, subunit alpha [Atopobiaceae bacterium]MCI1432283.1 L-serine ammonia-lyase, iron-sulfur-dependent, subunit alpha [Atopobiaceae bacterium]MCI1470741.1 L-serine ammonia-lyase, iron-sulfur-dependent, subunit alpha [Atopobiaceae bacterium]
MDETTYESHVAILHDELVCALGCTEPIAVAFAAAVARDVLGCEPERLEVRCSGNIIKNVKSVTVPNSGGLRGIEAAATLGAVGGDPHRALEVLEAVDDAGRSRASELISAGYCDVALAEDVPNLYVQVTAHAGDSWSRATIAERHTNIVELVRDGKACDPTPYLPKAHGTGEGDGPATPATADARSCLSLSSIWEFAHTARLADIEAPIRRQLELNEAISDEGLAGDWGANIGSTLLATRHDDVTCRARARAAAGSDARMSGCALPVVIICGSGNQGITASMPVLEYARELGSLDEELVRAVALSDLTAVHAKSYIGELSAFCGAVTAACGAGGAICMLRGGTFSDYEATVVNTLANVGGIVCDGAKPSCAAKIAASVDAALLGCDMALRENSFRGGDGLVASDAEKTIRSMGYVGRVGMHPTDVEILNIMIGKTDVDAS